MEGRDCLGQKAQLIFRGGNRAEFSDESNRIIMDMLYVSYEMLVQAVGKVTKIMETIPEEPLVSNLRAQASKDFLFDAMTASTFDCLRLVLIQMNSILDDATANAETERAWVADAMLELKKISDSMVTSIHERMGGES